MLRVEVAWRAALVHELAVATSEAAWMPGLAQAASQEGQVPGLAASADPGKDSHPI